MSDQKPWWVGEQVRIDHFSNGSPASTIRVTHLPTGEFAEASGSGSVIKLRQRALDELELKIKTSRA